MEGTERTGVGAGLTEPRHRLLLELGRGGMGAVYLAERLEGGERPLVVVKRLLSDLAGNLEFRQMFLDEARLTTRLRHPNVVRTFDVGFDGKSYWLEMEYLEGQAFVVLLRSRIPRAIALGILVAVLDGLHAAHELLDEDGRALQVVHRDVSPHNVFVTYDGEVKVLDFGIAKAADSSTRTRTGVVKGKLTYMAPEQATRRDVDRRADVFAVGIALWEVLHGSRFWGDLPDEEVYFRLRSGEVQPVSPEDPSVPAALSAVCRRAVAPSRDDRFATAEEMRDALVDAADGIAGRAEIATFVTEAWSAERDGLRSQVTALRTGKRMPADDVRLAMNELSRTYAADGTTASAATRSRSRRPLAMGLAVVALLLVSATLFVRARARTAPTAGQSAALTPECTSSAQCVDGHAGEPWVCRGEAGRCVAIASADCRLVGDAALARSDDTLWVGAMFPLTGPDAPKFGQASLDAVDLARRDFTTVAKGLPRANGAAPRPIGVIACDDAVDPRRAAHHLADDLRVPAVIGFHGSNEAIDLAQATFFPAGVLMVSALNTSALLTSIPHPPGSPRLMWRTAISTTNGAPAIAAIIGQLLEPSLRAPGGPVKPGTSMRVAVVRPNNTMGHAHTDTLVSALRFNGKTVVQNGDDFRDIGYGVPGAEEGASYADVVAQVIAIRPHVIAMLADQMTEEIVAPLERAWPASESFRPRYVFGSTLEGEEFFHFVGKNSGLRRRFFSMTPPSATAANAKLTMRFNELFSPKVSMATSPASPYDSFYLVAYAAVAAGDVPLTGAALSGGIARLVPPSGEPFDVGQTGIFDVVNALHAGKKIDLQGAYGNLDFDLATGEQKADFAILCLSTDASGAATESVDSGMVYDAREKRLRGSYRCP